MCLILQRMSQDFSYLLCSCSQPSCKSWGERLVGGGPRTQEGGTGNGNVVGLSRGEFPREFFWSEAMTSQVTLVRLLGRKKLGPGDSGRTGTLVGLLSKEIRSMNHWQYRSVWSDSWAEINDMSSGKTSHSGQKEIRYIR